MLQTIKDACKFDPAAINYALSDQIENLDDLIGHTAKTAETFFQKTYLTGGMKVLLRQGLQRLAGKSGQAVFELKQAMGGGKTHSMLALGYLAANPELIKKLPKEIAEGLLLQPAKVVAISGRSISREKHIWGDIATQLGRESRFLEFFKGAPVAPNEKDWIDLIGDQPTLILLDELPPYFKNAITQIVGGGTLADVTTYAVSNLLSAAIKLRNLCIVISNLSGSYEGATKEISALIHKATRDLQQETARQAKSITPVELGSDEIYHILRTRLLTNEPDKEIVESVAVAFSEAISDAVKAKAVAKSASQIADEVVASYPFHPSFKHILALFKDNERFRQTRGLMTLAAIMIKSANDRPLNDVYLVGCQHMDLANPEIRDAITNIYDLSGAIAHDIAGTGSERAHAQVIDDQIGGDSASQVARLVLMASLPEANGAVKGLTKNDIIQNLVAPLRSVIQFDEAFEKLRTDCWYLHRRDNDAWVFSKNENLRKKIEKYADGARGNPKIEMEMRRRLNDVFEPRRRIPYTQVLALPRIEEIKPNSGRVLLVLSPDRKVPPDDARRLFEAVPQKNNFCVVTGDGSDMGNLEEKVRRIWAVAKVREEDGGEKSPNRMELDEEAEQAEFEFNSTLINLFNRVFYPGRHPKEGEGLLSASLKLTPTKAKDGRADTIDGELAVEEALASTGASKLEREIGDSNADKLRVRAEDLLWLSADRRARWKDVEEQAICNVRWPWLPPRGLEDLKRRAISTGDWRDSGDGYVEKGPFPPPRTSVRVVTRSRDDDSGKATIEITAVNSGSKARVHFADNEAVSGDSPRIPDQIFETDATVLWFLAIDEEGKHETGIPEKWSNTLTLTHEPREVMGKRSVSLDVKPRGKIRWNVDGTNPREGQLYSVPIEIPGNDEVVVYAYAEDAGVAVQKNFTIRPSVGGKAAIDPTKAASVRKRITLATTSDVFNVLRAAKKSQVTLGNGISVKAGKGDNSGTTRFGPGVSMHPDAIEAFISSLRSALKEEAAEVEVGFGEISCSTGQNLEEFLQQVTDQIQVEPSEVIQ